jgi:hypothetical protein
MPAATVPAANPREFYRQCREAGDDHDAALVATMQAYRGRSFGEMEQIVEEARVSFERPAPVVEVPGRVEAEPDEFEEARVEARERIADLTAERQRCALDLLHSSARAGEMQKIEADLREASAAYERIDLAQAEQRRRDTEQAHQVGSEQRATARAEADQTGARAAEQWLECQGAAAVLAQALAEHGRLTIVQSSQLAAAGFPGAERVRQHPGAIRAAVADALQAAGASPEWLRP